MSLSLAKELGCQLGIKLVYAWLWVERILIKYILFSLVKRKVREFYRLDDENKDLIQVNNDEFYVHTANRSLMGCCESYMNGWISIKKVDEAIANVIRSGNVVTDPGFKYKAFLDYLVFDLFHTSSCQKSIEVADTHYNLGNDLFEAMLGGGMNYSCGLWLSPHDTLEIAQKNKMDLLAKKLKLKKGMRVLDIGCGWGGMAKYFAEEYGVSVVATTTSVEGAKYAMEYCKGLDVEVRVADCRDLMESKDKFDRILAVEVLVHVGKKNYRSFFSQIKECLKPDGIFLLHAIGSNDPRLPTVNNLHNTMIPDSRIPQIKDIVEDTQGLFVVEDWANIGVHYDRTALAWNKNFQRVKDKFILKSGEKFCKMWEFFLQTNAAVFRTRNSHIWHVVFSHNGLPQGYSY